MWLESFVYTQLAYIGEAARSDGRVFAGAVFVEILFEQG